MKIPETPPDEMDIIQDVVREEDKTKFMDLLSLKSVDSQGRWLHWEEFKRRPVPDDWTKEEYWAGMRHSRKRMSNNIDLFSDNNTQFTFAEPDIVRKSLHQVDTDGKFGIGASRSLLTDASGKSYRVASLIEEAFNSSILEGAVTTRDIAKRMIREDLPPVDESEQMILNNYHAMLWIRDSRNQPLSTELICHLHEIITKGTLEKPGQFRTYNDQITVGDCYGEVYHIPPNADDLSTRLNSLCQFVNATEDQPFIHPILKGIILHFMIGYEHPFVDGNGRTARALWYWFMAKHGYELVEFISISSIINEAPVQYQNAYLYTETDGFDLTYFIIHQLDVILKAILSLDEYIKRKQDELFDMEDLLDEAAIKGRFNYRQLGIIRHAAKNPSFRYRIKDHKNTHRVSYQTARTDLIGLADEGLLNKRRSGKQHIFVAPGSLRIDNPPKIRGFQK